MDMAENQFETYCTFRTSCSDYPLANLFWIYDVCIMIQLSCVQNYMKINFKGCKRSRMAHQSARSTIPN